MNEGVRLATPGHTADHSTCCRRAGTAGAQGGVRTQGVGASSPPAATGSSTPHTHAHLRRQRHARCAHERLKGHPLPLAHAPRRVRHAAGRDRAAHGERAGKRVGGHDGRVPQLPQHDQVGRDANQLHAHGRGLLAAGQVCAHERVAGQPCAPAHPADRGQRRQLPRGNEALVLQHLRYDTAQRRVWWCRRGREGALSSGVARAPTHARGRRLALAPTPAAVALNQACGAKTACCRANTNVGRNHSQHHCSHECERDAGEAHEALRECAMPLGCCTCRMRARAQQQVCAWLGGWMVVWWRWGACPWHNRQPFHHDDVRQAVDQITADRTLICSCARDKAAPSSAGWMPQCCGWPSVSRSELLSVVCWLQRCRRPMHCGGTRQWQRVCLACAVVLLL
jgi:hypothetical protein